MKKTNLKKQSQFAPALMGATSFVKGDYDKITGLRSRRKQSQYAGLWPEILSTKL
jgi:hypothetical protein